mmetsp:Transcript_25092/g.81127  ORF Transcript_25092/g.81127 Transcript_25092/m.81127 type:complete len:399 (-) Transcript_25092:420-1616(-)
MRGWAVGRTVTSRTLAPSGIAATWRTESATTSASRKPSSNFLLTTSSGDKRPVWTFPGWTTETAMPFSLPSRARLRVRPWTANFDAVYAADRGLGAMAEMEPMLMIRDAPCLKAYLEQMNDPTTLTSITFRNSATDVSSTAEEPLATPALFTRMSIFPCSDMMSRNNDATDSSSVTSTLFFCDCDDKSSPRRREASTTVAPASEKARAMALPMPPLAPVTRATLPSSISGPTSRKAEGRRRKQQRRGLPSEGRLLRFAFYAELTSGVSVSTDASGRVCLLCELPRGRRRRLGLRPLRRGGNDLAPDDGQHRRRRGKKGRRRLSFAAKAKCFVVPGRRSRPLPAAVEKEQEEGLSPAAATEEDDPRRLERVQTGGRAMPASVDVVLRVATGHGRRLAGV